VAGGGGGQMRVIPEDMQFILYTAKLLLQGLQILVLCSEIYYFHKSIQWEV
jgi:hypothetical protein